MLRFFFFVSDFKITINSRSQYFGQEECFMSLHIWFVWFGLFGFMAYQPL